MEFPKAGGRIFTEDHRTNLYYLNELYASIAAYVSQVMRDQYSINLNITSGIWGGTYLIAENNGKSKRRIWRLYCIVNLTPHTRLDKQENLEKLVGVYYQVFRQAFAEEGLRLELKMWGGRLPHTNKIKPNITMHLEDASQTVRWLRPIFVWNEATWEQSIIYDSIRLIKELKDNLDIDRGPTLTDPQQIKYLLQDVIITYQTLENAHSPEFIEHAEPIIMEMKQAFLNGLGDPLEIRDWYHKVLENMLVYGYEETLMGPYRKHGLDIRQMEQWPVNRINFVPEELQEKLIPPIQAIFATFRETLNGNGAG